MLTHLVAVALAPVRREQRAPHAHPSARARHPGELESVSSDVPEVSDQDAPGGQSDVSWLTGEMNRPGSVQTIIADGKVIGT